MESGIRKTGTLWDTETEDGKNGTMLTSDGKMYIAQAEKTPLYLLGKMANRHGLITGATGTGKTVSLQVIAETLSAAGCPCFMADMKGDLSGISQAGKSTDFIEKRVKEFGIADADLKFAGCPTRFFDVFGEQGHPLRTTISEMGPLLLARLMNLNDTQTGVLNIVFRIADEQQLMLIDTKDLRLMLDFVAKHAKDYTTEYGNIAAQTIGAIQRALMAIETQGGDKFFGEPAFNIHDFIATEGGRGVINVLAADKLMASPLLYSTFLLWMLSELYTQLPEVGDPEIPKLAFFFDEAHTLFNGTQKAFLDKVEQVVRLVRSKGVGVYFVTQLPDDVPQAILGQLGNRIQHALRAFTPRDQKAVKAAAQSFRANPDFDTEAAITELGTGEALVSLLDEKGAPAMVQKAKMMFPLSQIGPIPDDVRTEMIRTSPLAGRYDTMADNISAYEILSERNAEEAKRQVVNEQAAVEAKQQAVEAKAGAAASKRPARMSLFEKIFSSIATSLGRQVGTSIVRGVLGNILKK